MGRVKFERCFILILNFIIGFMARIAQIFNEIITRFGGWPKWNAGKGESK
jgi:hypothetical protein